MTDPAGGGEGPVDREDVVQRLLRRHPAAAPGVVVATVGVVLRRLRRRAAGPVAWADVHEAADEQLLLGRASRHEQL